MKLMFKTSSVKYVIIAILAVLFAIFVVLPMLPQVDSSFDAFSLHAPVAFAIGGDAGGGGDGPGGAGDAGGGCCGGGDGGGGDGGGGRDGEEPTPDPLPPVCTLNANPLSILLGGSSTLTWTTSRATSVSINQGIGSVALDGNKVVSPTQTKTYTLTATGNGGTVTCSKTITVTTPASPACELFVDPNQVEEGGNARVEWSSTNVTHVLITEKVGNQSPTIFEDTNATEGSVVITPTATTTYEGTFTGPGGVVTCEDTVTVVPKVVDPLLCTLNANPNSFPFGGGTTTLAWTTDNATSVSINQGIGSVALDGNLNRFVSTDTTFTLTAVRGNETKQCVAVVDVGPENTSPLCNSFTVTPNQLSEAGTVTLNWDTSFANNVSINNGIGSVTPDGSATTSVSTSTTFTLTASDGEETAQCQASVTVRPPENPTLSCDSFSANPSNLSSGGGNSVLTWNTTGATSVSIDQGIGSVNVDGSREVNVSDDITYTLTASNGNDSVTCKTQIEVDGGGGGGGGGSSRPVCSLFKASKEVFTPGDEITLRWETRRGTSLTIEPNIFETDDNDEVREGSVKVKPRTNTRYTLTVEKGSRKDTCTVDVKTGGPDITVLSARDQKPITTISLTEIPYTGFDAGPALTALFYTLLALWSLAIAYVLVVKRGSVFGIALPASRRHEFVRSSIIPHAEYRGNGRTAVALQVAPVLESRPAPVAPVNLPIGVFADDEEESEDEEVEEGTDDDSFDQDSEELVQLENRAHMENILLSSDALRMIKDAGATFEDRMAALIEIIARAKAAFPREDGWIVVNRERITALFR